MKSFLFLLLLSLLSSFQALATLEEEYFVEAEDNDQYHMDQVDRNPPFRGDTTSARIPKTIRGTGEWAYVFKFVPKVGAPRIVAALNENELVRPASTMKIFTGWWAFLTNNENDAEIGDMLRNSLNPEADALFTKMGGAAEFVRFFGSTGLDVSRRHLRVVDGSGFLYENQTTATLQIDLLSKIQRNKDYDRFKRLLARPGRDGTLEKRLLDFKGRLFAKTGTLNRTRTLSGFLETKKGVLIFSILADRLVSQKHIVSARHYIDVLLRQHARGL